MPSEQAGTGPPEEEGEAEVEEEAEELTTEWQRTIRSWREHT